MPPTRRPSTSCAHTSARELASYKRPDGLTIVDALPTNAMYKVDKRALRDGWKPT